MKISEFCLLNGTSLKKNEGKEGYLYLDTANITNGVIDSFQKYGFYEELPSRARRKVSNNSIVYSTVRPNQQHFGIITEPPDNLIVSTGFCVIDVDEKIADPRYVYYYLSQSSITKKLHAIAEQATTAYPSIKAKDLGDLEIDLPDLDRQHEVAQILTSLDKKILLNSAINDNLQQQAQLIYNISFEKADFHDLPSGWRVVSLGDVATISTKAFNPQKEPITALEHYSIPAFDENKFPTFESSSNIKSNKFIIDSSCFLISKLNPTTKRVWKPYCLSERAVCSTEFIVYRAKDNSISDFLYSVIDSQSFTNYMCTHVNGSTGSRQRTTPSETLSYKLLLPSRDVLERFQSMVSPMYDLIRLNSIENNRLKQLREALLQKLMSEK